MTATLKQSEIQHYLGKWPTSFSPSGNGRRFKNYIKFCNVWSDELIHECITAFDRYEPAIPTFDEYRNGILLILHIVLLFVSKQIVLLKSQQHARQPAYITSPTSIHIWWCPNFRPLRYPQDFLSRNLLDFIPSGMHHDARTVDAGIEMFLSLLGGREYILNGASCFCPIKWSLDDGYQAVEKLKRTLHSLCQQLSNFMLLPLDLTEICVLYLEQAQEPILYNGN